MLSIFNSLPVIGHLKGLLHYATGNTEEGNKAMCAATRATAVYGAGFIGTVGGPVLAAGASIYAGTIFDTVASGITGEPQGIVKSVTDIKNDIENGKTPYLPVLLTVVTVATDGMSGMEVNNIVRPSQGCVGNSVAKAAPNSVGATTTVSITQSAKVSVSKTTANSAAKTIGKTAVTESTTISVTKSAAVSVTKKTTNSVSKTAAASITETAAVSVTKMGANTAKVKATKSLVSTASNALGKSTAKSVTNSSSRKLAENASKYVATLTTNSASTAANVEVAKKAALTVSKKVTESAVTTTATIEITKKTTIKLTENVVREKAPNAFFESSIKNGANLLANNSVKDSAVRNIITDFPNKVVSSLTNTTSRDVVPNTITHSSVKPSSISQDSSNILPTALRTLGCEASGYAARCVAQHLLKSANQVLDSNQDRSVKNSTINLKSEILSGSDTISNPASCLPAGVPDICVPDKQLTHTLEGKTMDALSSATISTNYQDSASKARLSRVRKQDNYDKVLSKFAKTFGEKSLEQMQVGGVRIFQNIIKIQKQRLAKVLRGIVIMGLATQSVARITFLFLDLLNVRFSINTFISVMEYTKAYIENGVKKMYNVAADEIKNAYGKFCQYIENSLKTPSIQMLSDYKNILNSVEQAQENSVLKFRDVHSAVYHYEKHKNLTINGNSVTVTVEEYFQIINRILRENNEQYCSKIASETKMIELVSELPEYGKMKLTLRDHDGNWIVASCYQKLDTDED